MEINRGIPAVDTMSLPDLLSRLTREERERVVHHLRQDVLPVYGRKGSSELSSREKKTMVQNFVRMIAGHLLLLRQAA